MDSIRNHVVSPGGQVWADCASIHFGQLIFSTYHYNLMGMLHHRKHVRAQGACEGFVSCCIAVPLLHKLAGQQQIRYFKLRLPSGWPCWNVETVVVNGWCFKHPGVLPDRSRQVPCYGFDPVPRSPGASLNASALDPLTPPHSTRIDRVAWTCRSGTQVML